MSAAEPPLNIIHIDEHLVAIDKPAGLLVHRSAIDGDTAWIERQPDPHQQEPRSRQQQRDRRQAECEPVQEGDVDTEIAGHETLHERIGRRADQGPHATDGRSVGDREQQRGGEVREIPPERPPR